MIRGSAWGAAGRGRAPDLCLYRSAPHPPMLSIGINRAAGVSGMSVPGNDAALATSDGAAVSTARVWRELDKATFAVISHVTPTGRPRSSGVMCVFVDRRMYVVVAPDSWKARHVKTGDDLAVTVPVHRGGVLALLTPIPPATVSFHATVIVHPAGSLDRESVPGKLRKLLPKDSSDGCMLELAPVGRFVTYGVGVSLMDMAKPAKARARVPVV